MDLTELFMANDFAFMFYAGDYLRDTQCLSEKAQVAYDRIMCEHLRYVEDMKIICISQAKHNFFIKRLNEEEKQELAMVLVEIEGGFQIPWVAESISKYKAYSDSRRRNRTGKTKEDINNTCKTHENHMESESVYISEDVFINTLHNKKEISIDFEVFWSLYDKKVGAKEKLTKKWESLTDHERASAIDHIQKYRLAQPDKKYRKDPSTYLNNKSWNDEIIQSTNNKVKEKEQGFLEVPKGIDYKQFI